MRDRTRDSRNAGLRESRIESDKGTEETMEKRNLGHSGLLVSLVGLGCNNFGQFIDLEASRKSDRQGHRAGHHSV